MWLVWRGAAVSGPTAATTAATMQFNKGAAQWLLSSLAPPPSHRKAAGWNDRVPVRMDPLFSFRTQMSRDYSGLPFCYSARDAAEEEKKDDEDDEEEEEESGEGSGEESPPRYELSFGTTTNVCRVLCAVTYDDAEAVERLKRYIDHGYRHRWAADGLPATTARSASAYERDISDRYTGGFSLGFAVTRRPGDAGNSTTSTTPSTGTEHDRVEHYVYNHVVIRIYGNSNNQIVKFTVEPLSVRHRFPATPNRWLAPETCRLHRPIHFWDVAEAQIVRVGERVLYTYDVETRYANVPRSEKWGAHSTQHDSTFPTRGRLLGLIRGAVTVILVMTAMAVGSIRELQRDVDAYRAAAEAAAAMSKSAACDQSTPLLGGAAATTDKGATDLEGVHLAATSSRTTATATTMTSISSFNLFRPAPRYPTLFSALVGSGIHLFVVTLLCLALAVCGITGPSRPGSFASSAILLFAFTGGVAGFVGGRLHAAFVGHPARRVRWGRHGCAALSAILFPAATFLWIAACAGARRAGGSVDWRGPLDALQAAAALWLCVHAPLVLAGSVLAQRLPPPRGGKIPVHVFQNRPTQIKQERRAHPQPPPQSWHPNARVLLILLAGGVARAVFGPWHVHVLIALMLVLVGAAGYRRRNNAATGGTQLVPAAPPIDRRTVHDALGAAVAGAGTFFASLLEGQFALRCASTGLPYDAHGFALPALLLAAAFGAEVAALLAYARVRAGKYGNLLWFAFFGSGSAAAYVFVGSIVWFRNLGAVPVVATCVLYFATSLWISLGALLVFGSVGALGTLVCLPALLARVPVEVL